MPRRDSYGPIATITKPKRNDRDRQFTHPGKFQPSFRRRVRQLGEAVELLDYRLFFGPRRGLQGFFFGCLFVHVYSPTSGS